MKEVFREQAKLVLEKLDMAAKCGEEVDLQQTFFQYTMDSFGKIGFGVKKFDPLVPFHFDRAQRQLISLISLPWTRYTNMMV